VMAYGQVLARFGHALSDPTRARVLLALREARRTRRTWPVTSPRAGPGQLHQACVRCGAGALRKASALPITAGSARIRLCPSFVVVISVS
jgi:hypothetical protein